MPKKTIERLFFSTGADAKVHRLAIGLSQTAYWDTVGVTQTAASRYECGQSLPKSIRLLLHLAYAPQSDASALFKRLRGAQIHQV